MDITECCSNVRVSLLNYYNVSQFNLRSKTFQITINSTDVEKILDDSGWLDRVAKVSENEYLMTTVSRGNGIRLVLSSVDNMMVSVSNNNDPTIRKNVSIVN